MAYKTSVQIEMDASGAIRNLGLLGGQMQRTERQSVQSLGAIRSAAAGAAGTLATLGVGLGLASAIGTIQQFDQSLTKLRAISNATASDMKLLSAQARELGATTVYGANQAAEAQTYLAQAGLRVNDILGATPAVLQFARAGMLDLGQAADLATDLMAQMGLGVEDLNRISDVLVKSANSATTTVAQLGDAFSYAGPVANSFGLSLEETAAALGQISNAGIKAGRAGTGLLGVLRQLGNVTPQNEKLLKQYGLTIADVDVATRGFQPVVDTLAKAGLSAADAFQLFGSEAASAGLALTRGSAAYQQLVTTLGDAGGTARDTARIMSSDLTSAFKGLQSALDEYVLQLGDSGATGAMKEFVTTATGVINVLNGMGDQFIEAGGYSEDFATKIGAIAAPILKVQNQWDYFTETFGESVAESRNFINGLNASFYDAQAAVLQFGANGIDAFAGVSEGARKVISDALNPLISAMNYVGLTFANLLDNVGQIPAIGDSFSKQAASIRQGLIEPLELSDSALRSTSENMRGLAQSSLDLADNLRSVDYEEQRKQLKGVGDQMEIIRSYNENFIGSIEEALAPMDAYIAKMAGQGGAGGSSSIAGSTKEAEKAAGELERTLNSAMGTYGKIATAINPAGAAMDDYRSGLSDLNLLLENGRITQLEYTAAVAGAALEYNRAVRAADPYYRRIDELARQYGEASDKSHQLERAASDLHDQFSRGDITAQQYSERLGNVQDAQSELALKADETASAMAKSWEEASERIDETFADAFTGAFDSFEDFSGNLLDGFKRLLGELAYQATLKPIVVGFTSSVGGALGIDSASASGGAGGMGGIGDLASWGSKIYDGVTNGFGNVAWTGSSPTAYGGTGFANSATSGIGQTGLWGGSTSNFGGFNGIASAGAGYVGSKVGTEVGSSLFGKEANSSYGAMAGGAIGTYFGGPLGSFAGSAIGGMLDSAFGSGRKSYGQIGSEGLDAEVDPDGVWRYGQNPKYDGYTQKSQLGTIGIVKKQKTDDEALVEMVSAFVQVDNAIASMLDQSELSTLADELNGWTSDRTSNIGSIVGQRFNAVFDAVESVTTDFGDRLIQSLGDVNGENIDEQLENLGYALQLDRLVDGLSGNVRDYAERVVGETNAALGQTLGALVTSIQNYASFVASTESLNLNFDALQAGAVDAADAIVMLAGGISNLSQQQSAYFDAFYSADEQFEHLQNSLEGVLGTLPDTRDGIRSMVESLDLMSASGQQSYAAIMANVGSLDSYYNALERQREALDSARNAIAEQYTAINGSVANGDVIAYWFAQVESGGQTLEQVLASISSEMSAAGAAMSSYYADAGLISNANDALSSYNAQLASINDIAATRKAQLRDEQQAITSLSDLIDSLSVSDLASGNTLDAARNQYESLYQRARAGDTEAAQDLSGAASTYLELQRENASTAEEYARVYGEVTNGVSGLEDQFGKSVHRLGDIESIERQALLAQESARDTLLDQLNTQVETLIGIENLSELFASLPQGLASALEGIVTSSGGSSGGANRGFNEAGYLAANPDVAAAVRSGLLPSGLEHYLRHGASEGRDIPGFAAGGYHSGGLRLVGENGPELEVTGPSRIYDASKTAQMLNGGGNAELIAEIKALRDQVSDLQASNRAIASTNSKLASDTDRMRRAQEQEVNA